MTDLGGDTTTTTTTTSTTTTTTTSITTWLHDIFMQLVEHAAKNPKDFLVSFFICLTPLMLITGYLAFLMIKQIEDKEKSAKKKAAKSINMAKTRKKVVK